MVRRQLRHGGLARSPNRTLCGFQPGSHLRFLARRRSAALPRARATAELCASRCAPLPAARPHPPDAAPLRSLVFETLVRLDEAGAPQPCLALSWQHDAAAKRWQFNLRPGSSSTMALR
jgi:hypothetical protein